MRFILKDKKDCVKQEGTKMFTRFSAVTISVVFLWTNILWPAIPKKEDFWEGRKNAVQRLNKKTSPVLLTQLPLNNISPVQFKNNLDPVLNKTIGLLTVDALKRKEAILGIPDWVKSLSSTGVNVEDAYVAGTNIRNSQPYVILLQSIHGQPEAQRNIANFTENLINELEDAKVVIGLEGASGLIRTERYRAFPDKKILRDVADYYLNAGMITGAEFAGLTAKRSALLWGVENLDLYQANIVAFKETMPFKKIVDEKINNRKISLVQLKQKTFSPQLLELDRVSQDFHNGVTALSDYLKVLTGGLAKKHFVSGYPTLRRFMEAGLLEKEINFAKVEEDRKSLIETLSQKLHQTELDTLFKDSLAYRLRQIGSGEYYSRLNGLCRAYGIGFSPEMRKYIDYAILVDKIERDKLFAELETLEKTCWERLVTTSVGKKLVESSQNLEIIQKLTTQNLTPQEWKTYKSRKQDIQKDDNELSRLLPVFEQFYILAEARNQALVENLLNKVRGQKSEVRSQNNDKKLASSPQPLAPAVLVAGGFHTPGICHILKEKNVNYLVLSPEISRAESGSSYLDIFNREKTPLDKLFLGEKLFIEPPIKLGQSAPESYKWQVDSFDTGFTSDVAALTAFHIASESESSEELNDFLNELNRNPYRGDVSLSLTGEPQLKDGDGLVSLAITDKNGTTEGKTSYLKYAIGKIGSFLPGNKVSSRKIGDREVRVKPDIPKIMSSRFGKLITNMVGLAVLAVLPGFTYGDFMRADITDFVIPGVVLIVLAAVVRAVIVIVKNKIAGEVARERSRWESKLAEALAEAEEINARLKQEKEDLQKRLHETFVIYEEQIEAHAAEIKEQKEIENMALEMKPVEVDLAVEELKRRIFRDITVTVPEESLQTEIMFTPYSGWRAPMNFKEMNIPNVGRAAQAIAEWYLAQSKSHDKRPIIVAYDTRGIDWKLGTHDEFNSRRFAEEITSVLATHGIPVVMLDRALPAPIVNSFVREKYKPGLTVYVTGGHSAVDFNGIKLFGAYGSLLKDTDILNEINLRVKSIKTYKKWVMSLEKLVKQMDVKDNRRKELLAAAKAVKPSAKDTPSYHYSVEYIKMEPTSNIIESYIRYLLETFKIERGDKVLWVPAMNPMHGATAEVLKLVLAAFDFDKVQGAGLHALEVRQPFFDQDPRYYEFFPIPGWLDIDPFTPLYLGKHPQEPWGPNPTPDFLDNVKKRVEYLSHFLGSFYGRFVGPKGAIHADKTGVIGFSFDADGNRIYATDSNGKHIGPNELGAIILWYLATLKNMRGSVAKTFGASHLASDLARELGLRVDETPVGFNYLLPFVERRKNPALIGIDENGLVTTNVWKTRDDAIATAFLVLEIVFATGKTLTEILDEIYEMVGRRYAYKRLDLQVTTENKDKFNGVLSASSGALTDKIRNAFGIELDTVSMQTIKEIKEREKVNDLKIVFMDGSWVLMRLSTKRTDVIRVYTQATDKTEEGAEKKMLRLQDTLLEAIHSYIPFEQRQPRNIDVPPGVAGSQGLTPRGSLAALVVSFSVLAASLMVGGGWLALALPSALAALSSAKKEINVIKELTKQKGWRLALFYIFSGIKIASYDPITGNITGSPAFIHHEVFHISLHPVLDLFLGMFGTNLSKLAGDYKTPKKSLKTVLAYFMVNVALSELITHAFDWTFMFFKKRESEAYEPQFTIEENDELIPPMKSLLGRFNILNFYNNTKNDQRRGLEWAMLALQIQKANGRRQTRNVNSAPVQDIAPQYAYYTNEEEFANLVGQNLRQKFEALQQETQETIQKNQGKISVEEIEKFAEESFGTLASVHGMGKTMKDRPFMTKLLKAVSEKTHGDAIPVQQSGERRKLLGQLEGMLRLSGVTDKEMRQKVANAAMSSYNRRFGRSRFTKDSVAQGRVYNADNLLRTQAEAGKVFVNAFDAESYAFDDVIDGLITQAKAVSALLQENKQVANVKIAVVGTGDEQIIFAAMEEALRKGKISVSEKEWLTRNFVAVNWIDVAALVNAQPELTSGDALYKIISLSEKIGVDNFNLNIFTSREIWGESKNSYIKILNLVMPDVILDATGRLIQQHLKEAEKKKYITINA